LKPLYGFFASLVIYGLLNHFLCDIHPIFSFVAFVLLIVLLAGGGGHRMKGSLICQIKNMLALFSSGIA
jgi:hypothetical protein